MGPRTPIASLIVDLSLVVRGAVIHSGRRCCPVEIGLCLAKEEQAPRRYEFRFADVRRLRERLDRTGTWFSQTNPQMSSDRFRLHYKPFVRKPEDRLDPELIKGE